MKTFVVNAVGPNGRRFRLEVEPDPGKLNRLTVLLGKYRVRYGHLFEFLEGKPWPAQYLRLYPDIVKVTQAEATQEIKKWAVKGADIFTKKINDQ